MGWRTLLLLALVVAALAGYLLFKGKPPPPPPTATERALKSHRFYDAKEIVIWPKPKDQAEAIKIARRTGAGWWVREPLQDKASFSKLQELEAVFNAAVLLEGYGPETLKAQPDLVAQCGLDKPACTIQFHFPNETITLEMGGDAPMGDGIYIRRGDTIYRCPNTSPRSALNMQPDDARERILVDPMVMASLRVSRVFHRQGDKVQELELTRRHGGEFWITKPRNMRADQGVVTNYLRILQGLTVRGFLSGGVNRAIGPDQEPVFRIALESERGSEEIKIFGAPGSEHYWGHHTRRNIAFEISLKDGLGALEAKADLLRARMLVPIRSEDMIRIVLEPGGDRPAADLRMGMGMGQILKMHAPILSSLNPTRLSELHQGLTTMQVLEFLDDADPQQYGLGEGAFRISIQENRTRQTITLRLGKTEGKFTYVMREDEAHVAKVDKKNADRVRQQWTELLDLKVTELTLRPRRLEVYLEDKGDKPGKPQFAYRQDQDSVWRGEADQKEDRQIAELVDDLQDLRAVRALEPPADLGPALVLKLCREATTSDVLLELRAWLRDDTVLVAAQRPKVVFEVNHSLLRNLLKLWSK